ncbi:similar to Saccharomyces cerevisiae YOR076C SKI7 Coupling protein that mediates interactions between the Ski complex and the cytoplasmic exosome during 3'-5' RNA degradation [Maudiozyma barnettii]|uniref:Similar to Saccharomyces cerevisiae YOR076C SKI7 Coupling protein that mediates interactions between the Ski complex and the cytoplasmic exosome during 3'-5' RNA degradation n=1 Tax=Maudiozyma barnettii TaxID=61262 RepID=A0A8H2VII1_9SACH|nr:similar to Saccharomyces cerevisiae YOR076C SKI7 Coupling protein that mediates interactions between the Ski complex and the cytoplasmic exosome during 3'-5' RNA degradation [Kazachstania barnettii]CAB4256264.1 similar to Saccharomyces cerevisiae YOR076C SKI7 Coupling protein that mediates interactions between the Ski complex and the cytoplasmic exosome during 3'-5' RNA degradation [Kazachstania barnettii]CAD1784873.1 similar to Saccharomyces cerevisiae YOR076C SKI7 Coupling protein that media
MSKLEQLAKQRIISRQDNSTKTKGSNTHTKGASLLDRLKTSKNEKKTEPKQNLSDILKKSKTNPTEQPSLSSLSSRLHDLQFKIEKERNVTTNVKRNENVATFEISKVEEKKSKTSDSEELKKVRRSLSYFTDIKDKDVIPPTYYMTPVKEPQQHCIDKTYNNNSHVYNKRVLAELDFVFCPSGKRNRIAQNFAKLSPDDESILAQKGAFKDVTKKIANLSIKPPRRLQKNVEIKETVTRIDPQQYITKNKIHPTISIVALGHSGSGKSTLIGKLLYDQEYFKIQEVNDLKIRLERSQYRNEKYTFWSWLLDYDRKTSKVMEKSIRSELVHYGGYNYRITDVPGSKNMLSPELLRVMSNSDVGLLVIDCDIDGFENGFNLNGQIIEHCILAHSCGIKKLIIAMNKLDTVDWHEERFQDIKGELLPFLINIGFERDQLNWVPCCGIVNTKEDGLFKPIYEQMCPWNTEKRSVFEIIQSESITLSNSKITDINQPLTVTIDKSKIGDRCLGIIKFGNIQKDDNVIVQPEGKAISVKSIFKQGKSVPIAFVGDYISLEYKPHGKDKENDVIVTERNVISAPENPQLVVVNRENVVLDIELFDIYDTQVSEGTKLKFFTSTIEQDLKINKILNRRDTILKVEAEVNESVILIPGRNVVILRNNMNRTIGIGKILQ